MTDGRNRACTAALAAFVLAVVSAGCGPAAAPPQRVTYTIQHATQSFGDCRSADSCTKITLRWPEIATAPTDVAKDSIARFVRETITQPYEGGEPLASVDSVMAQFLEAYRSTASEFPEGGMIAWKFDRSIEVLGDTLGVLSLAVHESSFTGGAHPNDITRFFTLDTQTGRVLHQNDLLRDRVTARLDSLGEQAFRRVRGMPANQTLTDAGFWFEGGRFHLTENMAVTTDGLLFFFNDYEVGPHALGATELLLPWRDVKPLIKPDGPLGYRGT